MKIETRAPIGDRRRSEQSGRGSRAGCVDQRLAEDLFCPEPTRPCPGMAVRPALFALGLVALVRRAFFALGLAVAVRRALFALGLVVVERRASRVRVLVFTGRGVFRPLGLFAVVRFRPRAARAPPTAFFALVGLFGATGRFFADAGLVRGAARFSDTSVGGGTSGAAGPVLVARGGGVEAMA